MALSSLARGYGSWTGDLELDPNSGPKKTKLQGPTLFPCIPVDEPHKHGITVTPRARSSMSTYTYASKATEKQDGEMVLPKTFLTKKGAILLFTAPESLDLDLTEHEKKILHKRMKKKDVVSDMVKKIGTIDRLSKSVLMFGDENYSADSASISDEENRIFLKFIHGLDKKIDFKSRPGAHFLHYLSQLKSRNSSRISRISSAVDDEEQELYDILQEMDKLIVSAPGGASERLSADTSKLTEQYTRPVTSMTVRVNDDNRLASATSSRSYRVLSTERLRASLKSSGYHSQPTPPTSSALRRPVSTGESVTYLSTFTPYGTIPSRPTSSPPFRQDSPRSRSIHLNLQQQQPQKKGEDASYGDSISLDDNDLYTQQLLHESDKYALHASNTVNETQDELISAKQISADQPSLSRPDLHVDERDLVEGQGDLDLDVASIATSLLEEEDINLPSDDEEHRLRRRSSAKSSAGKSTALPPVEQTSGQSSAGVLPLEGSIEMTNADENVGDIADYEATSDAAKPLVPPYEAMGFLNGSGGVFTGVEGEVAESSDESNRTIAQISAHQDDQKSGSSEQSNEAIDEEILQTNSNVLNDKISSQQLPEVDLQDKIEGDKTDSLHEENALVISQESPEGGAVERNFTSQQSSADHGSPVQKSSSSRPVSGVSSSRASSDIVPHDDSNADYPPDGPAVLTHPKESSLKTVSRGSPTAEPIVSDDSKDIVQSDAKIVDVQTTPPVVTPAVENLNQLPERSDSVMTDMHMQQYTPLTVIKEEEKVPDHKPATPNEKRVPVVERKSDIVTSPKPEDGKSSVVDSSKPDAKPVTSSFTMSTPGGAKQSVPAAKSPVTAKSPVEKKAVEKPVKPVTPTVPKSATERKLSRGAITAKPSKSSSPTEAKSKKSDTNKAVLKKSETTKQYTKALDISSMAKPDKTAAKPSSPVYRLLEDDDDIIPPVKRPQTLVKEPEPTISQEEIEKKLRMKELEEERIRQQQEAEAIAKLEAEVTKVFDEGISDAIDDEDEDGGMTAEELQLQKQLLQEKLEQAEKKIKGEEDKPAPKTKARKEVKKKGKKEKKTEETPRDVAAEKEALREAKRAERERRAAEARQLEEKIREQEETKRRAEMDADRKKKDLEEEMQDLKEQAEEAMRMEEDARQDLAAVRKAAKEEREARRKADIDRKKQETKAHKEQQRKQMENARRREKEMLQRIASADQKKRMQEEEQRQREEEDRLLAEKLAEQERLALQAAEEEEERIAELERQAEEEAMARLVAEREDAEKRRRQLMREKEEMEGAEERKREAMLEEQMRLEEERRRQQEAEDRRKEEERQRLIELQRMEAEARERMKAEIEKRREEALKRREKNMERRGNLDCLRNKQGLTKPWIFSYYVLWPRETYERLMGEDPKKKKGFRPKPKPKKKT